MKILITLKDPDALQIAIDDYLEDLKIDGVSEDELEAVKEKRKEEIEEICRKWFEYGECLNVEVDIAKKTIQILEPCDVK